MSKHVQHQELTFMLALDFWCLGCVNVTCQLCPTLVREVGNIGGYAYVVIGKSLYIHLNFFVCEL